MRKKNFTRSKPLFFTSLIILVGLFIALFWLNNTGHISFPGNNTTDSGLEASPPTEEEKKAQAAAELDSKRAATESKPVANGTAEQTQTQENASVKLTAKTEQDGTVTLITKLFAITDGTCKLTIQNGTSTYTDNAEVIYQPEYSSCAGFSVPVNRLGAGNWNIRLSVVTTTGKTYSETISQKVE